MLDKIFIEDMIKMIRIKSGWYKGKDRLTGKNEKMSKG